MKISLRASYIQLFACIAAALLALQMTGNARAQVTTDGDVLPASYPQADIEIGVTDQTVDLGLLPTDEQPNYERGDNIMVGSTASGTLRVLGGRDLRWQHLILGGTIDDFDGDDVSVTELMGSTIGSGSARFEGFGTSFNNHPQIIPTQYQDIYPFVGSGSDPESTYFPIAATQGVDIDFDLNPDFTITTQRPSDVGYDAIIGLTGHGELYLNTGARMEIEDAFIVGYGPNSTGYVEVDGIGTYLGVYGGLRPNASGGPVRNTPSSADTIHQMIIGGYSQDAQLHITGGATVDAFFGAAIGVTRSDGDDELTNTDFDGPNDPQGNGKVVVDGAGSTWNIAITAVDMENPQTLIGLDSDGGALAIGEFDVDRNGYTDNTNNEGGRGSLSIRNGGQVNVSRYVAANSFSYTINDDADVRIGFGSTLDFQGGKLTATDQVVNEGVIQASYFGQSETGGSAPGGGEIVSASFENLPLGEVHVDAGQTLKVVSNITTGDTAPNAFELLTAGNAGLIEVTGDLAKGRAKFEFVRDYDNSEDVAAFPSMSTRVNEVFYNAGEVDGFRGEIVVQEGELRFKNGLWNSGDIAFVGGDNIVNGIVMNASNPTTPTTPQAEIVITNQSHVTFEDTVTNDGLIAISDDSSATFLGDGTPTGATVPVAYNGVGELALVSTTDTHVQGNFALGDEVTDTGGTLSLYIEDFAADAFSHLVIDGAADFNFTTPGLIRVFGNVGGNLMPGDEIDLITVLGGADFTGVNTLLSIVASDPAINFTTVFTPNSFTLQVVAAPVIATVAGDFNGDGVVDAADYAVWRLAYENGLPLINEDNNIGVTDLGDYQTWRDNFGMTFPAPPASSTVAVPEPAALGLLAMGGLLAARRRRS